MTSKSPNNNDFLYRFLINLLLIFSPFIILIRLFKKKESPKDF